MPRWPERGLAERFWAKVDSTGDCWEWKGAVDQGGYGAFRTDRRVLAHRLSYELARGPIPAGLHIDHLCRNKRCVKPDHLEAVTQAENNHRANALRPRRLWCTRGHLLSGEPRCRECNRRYQREWWRRNRRKAS